jgi:predicted dehydrogenase
VEKLLHKAKLAGRLTHVGGQWNSRVKDDIGWPQKFAMRDADLQQYGYASMHELRNWRTLKKYSAGVFAEFAAQAVDVADWFLGAAPKSVMAAGGLDYYKTHEGLDTVTAVLEYETAEGTVRATCEVETTTSAASEITFEHFMGIDGSIKISEHPKWTKVFREPHAASWEDWVRQGYLRAVEDPAVKQPPTSAEEHVRETGTVVPYELPVVLDKPLHQPHLENFFDAVRGEISTAGKAKLNSPAEEAFRTEVVVHKVNQAVEAKRMLPFTPEDFKV